MGCGVAAFLVGGVAFLRPPQAGNVYRSRADAEGQVESTFILLRSGECLVLSQSAADIGRSDARRGNAAELFTIIAGRGVSSDADREGLYLLDRRSGLVARPGLAIDGVIIRRPPVGRIRDALDVGWPMRLRCGHRLAEVLSISRVHR